MYTAIRLAKAIGFKRLIRNVGFGNVEARVRVGGSGSDDPPLRGGLAAKDSECFQFQPTKFSRVSVRRSLNESAQRKEKGV